MREKNGIHRRQENVDGTESWGQEVALILEVRTRRLLRRIHKQRSVANFNNEKAGMKTKAMRMI